MDEKKSQYLNVYLGDLKQLWAEYCRGLGKKPGAALKEAVESQLTKVGALPSPKLFQQSHEAADDESKVRFEILLTPSEKHAVSERARSERCSQRRWIVDAIRTGLTREPQFGMREIEALGESNYQLLSIGRNLNQIAKRLNEGGEAPVVAEDIEQLREQIKSHSDAVSAAIRASLERWVIE